MHRKVQAHRNYRSDFWIGVGTAFSPTKMNRLFTVCGLILGLLCGASGSSALAQSVFYVRAGATGNGSGSDWANAMPSLPSNMQRGATYYVAGGSYSSMSFTTPASGSAYITIRKATVENHGTSVGWMDSYGTQQAVFNAPISFRSDYWIFDGGTRNENNWFDGSAYGFMIRDNGNVQIDQRGIGGIDNITIRNTYLKGINSSPGSGGDIGRRHVWIDRQGNPGTYSNWTISRCFFQYGNVGVQVRECANFVCEYNAFADNWSSQPNNHGENVSAYYGGNDGHIYRFNRSRNMIGTAAWAVNVARNWQVYGNVYEDCEYGDGFIGFIGGSCTGFQIYNETIIRPKVYTRQVSLGGNSVVKNCIFMMGNLGTPSFDGCTVSSCSFSGSGTGANAQTSLATSTFVNYSGGDYRLARATAAGESLPSPFNVDLLGNVRGADGVADRGAFEYTGSVTDVTPPTLSNIGVSLSTPLVAVITWITSEPATGVVDYGTTTSYGATVSSSSLATSHTVTITGLSSGTTYNYRIRATDAAGNQSSSGNLTFSTGVSDTVAPSVTLSSPSSGSVLKDLVTISATASDNVGVVGVRFFVSGIQLTDDATSPYSYQWDSTAVANGTYQIYAQARDAAGNTRWSATNTVTVSNPIGALPSPNFYWSFNEGAGTTSVDSFANSVMTLRNGATWTTGKAGNGLVFDGVNDRADAPHSAALNITGNAITVSTWVKLENLGTWQQILAKVKDVGAFNAPYFAWHLFGGHASASTWTPMFQLVNAEGSGAFVSSATSVAYGQWVHLVGVYDGTMIRIYVNGVEQGSAPQSGNIISYSQPLYIGAHGGPGEFMKGAIDELRIYARALTAAQVQSLYQASSGPAAPTALRVVFN